MAIETERAELHALVDAIPKERLAEAKSAIKLLTVPEDDEPVTESDLEALRQGREESVRGELIPGEVVRREIGF